MVTVGAAIISASQNRLDITQTSQRAIIDWQTFNIGQNAQVRFQQPDSASVVLNRISGQSPSQIYGSLHANGQVFLLNSAGIVFGPNAQVNVAGLVASTMSLSDGDFMAGNYRFSRNGSTGSVVNLGALTATQASGYISLLAPELRNEGVISARLGSVVLAAGERITLRIADLVSVSVDPSAINSLVENRAMILAEGGRVIMSAKALDTLMSGAINMNGIIEASSLTSKGGEVVLDASGSINLGGRISATGRTGGTVTVLGGGISTSAATIDASGIGEGGSIQIGDLSSKSTVVGSGTVLLAKATQSGSGGNIETSGQALDIVQGVVVDAGSNDGKAGRWLLDPQNLTITSGGAGTIASALGTTDVTVTTSACSASYGTCSGTNGDITIANGINPVVTNSAGTTLTMLADRNITLNSNVSIDATGGANKLNVVLNANASDTGGAISLAPGSSIKSNGGNIYLVGGSSGNGYSQGSSTFNTGIGVDLNNAQVLAGGGDILMRGRAGAGLTSVGVRVGYQSTVSTTGAGNITLDGIGGDASGGNPSANGNGRVSAGIQILDRINISTVNGAITLNGEQANVVAPYTSNFGLPFDGLYGIAFTNYNVGGAAISGVSNIYTTAGDIFLNTDGNISNQTVMSNSRVNFGFLGSGSGTTGRFSLSADKVNFYSVPVNIKASSLDIATNTLVCCGGGTLETSGGVTIAPLTTGKTMSVGGYSPADLYVSTGTLNAISGYSSLTLGNANTGNLTISALSGSFSAPLTFRSGGTVKFTGSNTISDSATDTAIQFIGNKFVNSGNVTLNTPSGRWLAYSNIEADDSPGSIISDFKLYSCTYAGTCSGSIPLSGNGMIYATAQGTPSTSGNTGGAGGSSGASASNNANTNSASVSRETQATPGGNNSPPPLPRSGTPSVGDFLADGMPLGEALKYGYSLTDLKSGGYSATDFQASGIPAISAVSSGWSLSDVLAAGYKLSDFPRSYLIGHASELQSLGYSVVDFKKAGLTLSDLKSAIGFTYSQLAEAGYTAKDLSTELGITLKQLKLTGVPINSFIESGYTPRQMLEMGFTALDLKSAGYDAATLKVSGVQLSTLRQLTYTPEQLKGAGYGASDMRAEGFDARQLKDGGYSLSELKDAGYPLVALRDAGYSARALLDEGYQAQNLRQSGFTLSQLRDSGLSVDQLKDAGYSLIEMKSSGVPISDLASVGYSARDLRSVGYSAANLRDAGYSVDQLRAGGYSLVDLIDIGYQPKQLTDGGFSVESLKNNGYAAIDLLKAGYTPSQLKDGGYSLIDIRQAGSPVEQIKNLGYSIFDLKNVGYSAKDLIGAGYSLQQLKDVGFTLANLVESGVPISQLGNLGYPAPELLKAGYWPSNLTQGKSAADLIRQNLNLTQVRELGYSLNEVLNSGYSPKELLEAGYTMKDFAAAKYPYSILKNIIGGDPSLAAQYYNSFLEAYPGYLAASAKVTFAYYEFRMNSSGSLKYIEENGPTKIPAQADPKVIELLKEGNTPAEALKMGYNVGDLLAAGYSRSDILKSVRDPYMLSAYGFSATELYYAGHSEMSLLYTFGQLPDVGYLSLTQLKKLGASPIDLKSEGFTPAAMREAGFTVEDFKKSGLTLSDILNAGFSTEQLKAGGYIVDGQNAN